MSKTIQTDVIITGDSLEILKNMPDGSVHCCVTSPPYYNLRDYGAEGQIGREATPKEYITRLVEVFREVYRVLKTDGTFWLNISDTYGSADRKIGCKSKDMLGIPWTLALALRDDGWYLRSDVIWEKANPMPESVRDRCTRCYEHVFQLAKSKKYYYDNMAIAEPIAPGTVRRMRAGRSAVHKYAAGIPGQSLQAINQPRVAADIPDKLIPKYRNKRDVWHINTASYSGSHFAVFPPKLAETCVISACPAGGIVLDPFFGSGTTGLVSKQNGRHYIGIDISPEYCALAKKRIDTQARNRTDKAAEDKNARLHHLQDKTAHAAKYGATCPPKEAMI